MKVMLAVLCLSLAACAVRPDTPKSAACSKQAEAAADKKAHWQSDEWLFEEKVAYKGCMAK